MEIQNQKEQIQSLETLMEQICAVNEQLQNRLETLKEREVCVICFERNKETLLIPCGKFFKSLFFLSKLPPHASRHTTVNCDRSRLVFKLAHVYRYLCCQRCYTVVSHFA